MNRLSIRKINESNVLREVFNKAPISRADVSKTLELTKSTVYSIFTKLENDDLIYDIGQGSSTRSGGRKPALTNFNANAGYTINTKINQNSIGCMLNWLDGSTISYQEYPLEGQDVSQRLLALYQAIKLSQLDNKDLLGISVSIYGVVRDNHVIKANISELAEYDLVQILQSRFNVPVLLGNEANMEAIYS
jgi:Transcriptional regulator/sugar kinase